MKKCFVLILAAAMLLSLAACGSAPAAEEKKADLSDLYESCTSLMTPMMPVDDTMRLDFMGIDGSDCAQVYTAFAEDGLLADELWLIEAKDQEAFDRLKALAENRMQAKRDETESYSPDQFEVVKQGVILEQNLYLALIVSPNVEQVKAEILAALQ